MCGSYQEADIVKPPAVSADLSHLALPRRLGLSLGKVVSLKRREQRWLEGGQTQPSHHASSPLDIRGLYLERFLL